MDHTYCDKKCPIGIKASKECLDQSNSAYEAAMDFLSFVDECFKTCPFKKEHTKEDL